VLLEATDADSNRVIEYEEFLGVALRIMNAQQSMVCGHSPRSFEAALHFSLDDLDAALDFEDACQMLDKIEPWRRNLRESSPWQHRSPSSFVLLASGPQSPSPASGQPLQDFELQGSASPQRAVGNWSQVGQPKQRQAAGASSESLMDTLTFTHLKSETPSNAATPSRESYRESRAESYTPSLALSQVSLAAPMGTTLQPPNSGTPRARAVGTPGHIASTFGTPVSFRTPTMINTPLPYLSVAGATALHVGTSTPTTSTPTRMSPHFSTPAISSAQKFRQNRQR